ncbi:MAG: efflux RND transporter periplasmic adaptor subunit [Burkholderiaceae bacterium]
MRVVGRLLLCATLLAGAGIAGAQPARPAGDAQAVASVREVASERPRVLLMPEHETTLVAQAVGRIERLGGGLGDSFRAGATLVGFDCAEQQARLKIGQAELDSARRNLEAKERLSALQAAGEIEVQIARAAVDRASAQVELANVQISQCRIRAPFAGRIAKLHVREHQGVNIGQPLMDIVAVGPLKLRLNVPSRWLAWLVVDHGFEVAIDETGKQYPAIVSALNARVDAVSQSIEIEARIVGKHPELLPGMSGTARFDSGT